MDEFYEDLIVGMCRERAMLEEVFETVRDFDYERALQVYAVGVDSLSDEDKKQAIMDAVLKDVVTS